MTWNVIWSKNGQMRLKTIRLRIRKYSPNAKAGTEAAKIVRANAMDICSNVPESHKDISEYYRHLCSTPGESVHKLVCSPYVIHVHLDPARNTASIIGIWHEKEDRPED